jgi:tetratricopeptide (TPR) repeat protein
MDPTTAEDPAPLSSRPSANDEEAANAPRTAAEVERVTRRTRTTAPAVPALATSVPGAVQLIKDGKHDLARDSLEALGKKNPASAYIPFLLGNVYFEQRWWSVAMDHYAIAIKKNPQYRSNGAINRNVIRMLASNKTAKRAEGFLKYTVGKSALPYVKYAAQHDANTQVKRLSGWLAKNI